MGVDPAMKKPVEGLVLELLPQAAYRVELSTRTQITAHAASASQANFVRLRPKDRVLVELSPHDPTRGRITKVISERV